MANQVSIVELDGGFTSGIAAMEFVFGVLLFVIMIASWSLAISFVFHREWVVSRTPIEMRGRTQLIDLIALLTSCSLQLSALSVFRQYNQVPIGVLLFFGSLLFLVSIGTWRLGIGALNRFRVWYGPRRFVLLVFIMPILAIGWCIVTVFSIGTLNAALPDYLWDHWYPAAAVLTVVGVVLNIGTTWVFGRMGASEELPSANSS